MGSEGVVVLKNHGDRIAASDGFDAHRHRSTMTELVWITSVNHSHKKARKVFTLWAYHDFDNCSDNHQPGKYTPESLISLTRSDEQSSRIHEPWFPKVQEKNQTHIVS